MLIVTAVVVATVVERGVVADTMVVAFAVIVVVG